MRHVFAVGNGDIMAFLFRYRFWILRASVDMTPKEYGVVLGLALLLVFFSTFLFVSGFTILLFLISTFFFVLGNAFGYFNLFADLVMFRFVGSLVRSNFFLAFPVLFLAWLVELNIVAMLFGYFCALLVGDFFAVGVYEEQCCWGTL